MLYLSSLGVELLRVGQDIPVGAKTSCPLLTSPNAASAYSPFLNKNKLSRFGRKRHEVKVKSDSKVNGRACLGVANCSVKVLEH